MSKSQNIRDALAAGPLTFRNLHLKVGGDEKKLRDLLYFLRHSGEVKIGDDEDKTVSLNARRAPPQGRRAKSAGKKAVKRPYKRLAEKIARRNGVDLPGLALENYVGAGALLRQAIEDAVEDLENAFGLRNALANHDRAEKILAAAKNN